MARGELKIGSVREERRGIGQRFFIDLRDQVFGEMAGRVYSFRGIGFATREMAQGVLEHIRMEIAKGRRPEDVAGEFSPRGAPANQIPRNLQRWLAFKREQEAAGDRSLGTLREYERWCGVGPNAYFAWWADKSIGDIELRALRDWSLSLARKHLGPKTRKNVLGGFRSFCSWLASERRGFEIPSFEWPPVPRHKPIVLQPAQQERVLEAIPLPKRGIFLAMARLGVRPNEAIVVRAWHYEARIELAVGLTGGILRIRDAVKGRSRLSDPVRAPKNGEEKVLPVIGDLYEWIEAFVSPERRLSGGYLFVNSDAYNPAQRWTPAALKRVWYEACQKAKVARVSMYQGTKHSLATKLKSLGRDDRAIAEILGHRDIRSVQKYAEVQFATKVETLRPGTRP